MAAMTEAEAVAYAPQWGSYINNSDPGYIMYSVIPPEQAAHRDEMVAHIKGHCLPIATGPHGEEGDEDELGRLVAYLEGLSYGAAYLTEFPDYPADAIPCLPKGFVDRSWKQEPCPCFIHDETGLVLWVGYPDDDGPRFSLQRATTRHPEAGWQFDGGLLDLCETDDWAIMARSIPNFINATEGK
jgi:hypothetical protein